jgi:non-specific serine/threonine protein kinase
MLHAAVACPDFRLDESNAADVARVCRALDGIPLALELAAALLEQYELGDIVAELASRLAVDTLETRPTRHSTLAAAIELSYLRLDSIERQAFEWLSVFSGGFTLEAAAAVCGNGADHFGMLDRLMHLVDRSLLRVERMQGTCGTATSSPFGCSRKRVFRWPVMTASHAAGIASISAQPPSSWSHRSAMAIQIDALERFEADHQNLLTAFRACTTVSGLGATQALRLAKRLGAIGTCEGNSRWGETRSRPRWRCRVPKTYRGFVPM